METKKSKGLILRGIEVLFLIGFITAWINYSKPMDSILDVIIALMGLVTGGLITIFIVFLTMLIILYIARLIRQKADDKIENSVIIFSIVIGIMLSIFVVIQMMQ